jgi:hypothetical protein
MEVVQTLAGTPHYKCVRPVDPTTGRIDLAALTAAAKSLGAELAAVVARRSTVWASGGRRAISDLAADCGAAFVTVVDP